MELWHIIDLAIVSVYVAGCLWLAKSAAQPWLLTASWLLPSSLGLAAGLFILAPPWNVAVVAIAGLAGIAMLRSERIYEIWTRLILRNPWWLALSDQEREFRGRFYAVVDRSLQGDAKRYERPVTVGLKDLADRLEELAQLQAPDEKWQQLLIEVKWHLGYLQQVNRTGPVDERGILIVNEDDVEVIRQRWDAIVQLMSDAFGQPDQR